MKKVITITIIISICITQVNLLPNISPQTPPPPTGDWDIFDTTVINNSVIIVTGNITIHPSGSLTLDNVTLIMNCTHDGEFRITVNGTLNIINGTNITAYDPNFNYDFVYGIDSRGNIRNSVVEYCGYSSGGTFGLKIDSDNITIIDSKIRYGYIGIWSGFSPTIINNTIELNIFGIFLDFSSKACVLYNTVITNQKNGIFTAGSSSPTIKNNNVQSIVPPSSTGFYGINILDSSSPFLENNTITNVDAGIFCSDSSSPVITNNTVINSNGGIRWLTSNSIEVSGNRLINISKIGVGFYSPGTISNNILINNSIGIRVVKVDPAIIINCTIINSAQDDLKIESDSHVTLVNTTFNELEVFFNDADSTLTIQWYMDLNVTNSSGDPVQDANVNVYNFTDDLVADGITGSDGFLRWIVVTERIQNSSTNITHTPHNVTVSKGGYNTGYAQPEPTVDKSLNVNITLIPTANDPPYISINEPITGDYAGTIWLNTTIIDINGDGDTTTYMYKIDSGVWEPLVHDSNNYWNASIDSTTLTDGLHTIYIIANDTFGNSNATEFVIVIIDNTAPIVTINFPIPDTYAGMILLNLTISDEADNGDPTTYKYKIDSGIWQPVVFDSDDYWSANIDTKILSDGSHTIHVVASDILGNSNITESVTIDVDNTAPTVLINSPLMGIYTGTIQLNTTILDETSNGDSTSYEFKIDSGVWMPLAFISDNYWNANIDTTILTDGSHTIRIIANDTLGNSNTTEYVTIEVDNTAPTVAINFPLIGIYAGPVQLNTTVIDGAGNGDPSTYKYKVDQGLWKSLVIDSSNYWVAIIDTTTLTDGIHTIYIIANDTLGNSNITESVIINVDNTGPIITINSPVEGIYAGVVRLNVSIIDTGGNGDTITYKYRIDTQDWNGLILGSENYWVADIDTIPIDDGIHTIYIQAYDSLGNSFADSIAITMDNTKPSVIITSKNECIKATFFLNATITDVHLDLGKIWYSIDEGDNIELSQQLGSDYQAIIDTSSLSDGPHTITVIASDMVGNLNNSESILITVDHTPPTVILNPLPSKTTKRSVTITGRTEPNAPVKVLLNGIVATTSIADSDGEFNLMIELSKGNNEIIVRATDTSGNTAESTPQIIRLVEESSGVFDYLLYILVIVVIATILLIFLIKKKGKKSNSLQN